MCPAPNRLIVGVDGSEDSEEALRWANTEAAEWGKELLVVQFAAADSTDTALRTSLEARLQHEPRRARTSWESPVISRKAGARADYLLLLGRAGDWLVLGAGGHGISSPHGPRRLPAKVVRRCVERTRCPVVIVRAGSVEEEPTGRIVVGFDDTPNSRAALAWAFDETVRSGGELVAIHVLELKDWPPHWSEPDMMRAAHRMLRRNYAVLQSGLPREPKRATGLVLPPSDPVGELIAHGRNADLLVCGKDGPYDVAADLVRYASARDSVADRWTARERQYSTPLADRGRSPTELVIVPADGDDPRFAAVETDAENHYTSFDLRDQPFDLKVDGYPPQQP
jgi:nucleotide-binding universal stress UspA family protein